MDGSARHRPRSSRSSRRSTAEIVADRIRDGDHARHVRSGHPARRGGAGVAARGEPRARCARRCSGSSRRGCCAASAHRGLFVRELGADDVRDVYIARTAVERAAALLVVAGDRAAAAERLTGALAAMEAAAREATRSRWPTPTTTSTPSSSPRPAARGCGGWPTALLVETRMCLAALQETAPPADLVDEHRCCATPSATATPGGREHLVRSGGAHGRRRRARPVGAPSSGRASRAAPPSQAQAGPGQRRPGVLPSRDCRQSTIRGVRMAHAVPGPEAGHPGAGRPRRGRPSIDTEGRRYLDFTAGIGVTSTGHCHPQVVAAAQEQVATLIHGQYTTVMHQPLLRLAERLGDVLPRGLDSVFFLNSGSEAVEASVRLARQATGRPIDRRLRRRLPRPHDGRRRAHHVGRQDPRRDRADDGRRRVRAVPVRLPVRLERGRDRRVRACASSTGSSSPPPRRPTSPRSCRAGARRGRLRAHPAGVPCRACASGPTRTASC